MRIWAQSSGVSIVLVPGYFIISCTLSLPERTSASHTGMHGVNEAHRGHWGGWKGEGMNE